MLLDVPEVAIKNALEKSALFLREGRYPDGGSQLILENQMVILAALRLLIHQME